MEKGSTMLVINVFLFHKVRQIFSANDLSMAVKTKLQKARNSGLISMHRLWNYFKTMLASMAKNAS